MTSFLTTGGIRGGKVSMEKFTPRTFNMGFSRKVYVKVGGFREMFSEDIDMSTHTSCRIQHHAISGCVRVPQTSRQPPQVLASGTRLWHVAHNSRTPLSGFNETRALVAAVFTVGAIGLCIGAFFCKWLIIPLALYIIALFIGALVAERSFKIAGLGVAASLVQLLGYGTGFIKAYTNKIILHKGRDEAEEIEIRKGKNEKL